MSRRLDWQERLRAELQDAADRAWAPGRHDCCMLVARCIRAMTDEDLAASVGPYRTRNGGQAILAAHGGMTALVSRLLGPPIPPEFARAGDVALTHNAFSQDALGICFDGGVVLASSPGIVKRDAGAIIAAWRV